MLDFTKLAADLTQTDSANASAKVLLEKLFAEIEANKTNPEALQALVDKGRAANDALATAIAQSADRQRSGAGDSRRQPPPHPR